MRHTGSTVDAKGRYVQGSGLLADGVKVFPEVQRMMDSMVSKMAGRKTKNLHLTYDDAGRPLQFEGIKWADFVKDKNMHQALSHLLEKNPDGSIKYQFGQPIPLTEKAMTRANAQIGTEIVGILEGMSQSALDDLPNHQFVQGENGAWVGSHLSRKILDQLNPSNSPLSDSSMRF